MYSFLESTIDSSVLLQQDLARKNNVDDSIADLTDKLINESMGYATKFVQSQNQFMSQFFAVMTENTKMTSENSEPFTKWCYAMIDLCTPMWSKIK